MHSPLFDNGASLAICQTVADPAMGGPCVRPPIDQNLGLVMAAQNSPPQTPVANFQLNP